jgi:hypothetical protein
LKYKICDYIEKPLRNGEWCNLECERANRAKYCRDCKEATIHETGSQLWVSCRLQSGWRDINSTCNLPEIKKC